MWSEAVHQMHKLWSLPGGAGQGQPPPVFYPEPPNTSYKVCRWLLLVLGMEVCRRGQALNQGWELLVSGRGPLSEKYRVHRGQKLLI